MQVINGAGLALAAAEMADAELEDAKKLLQSRVIPHLINSIWEFGEATRNSKGDKKQPLRPGVVAELARLAVTFPGSVALKAMSQVLDSEKFETKVATDFVDEFGRLSRESLSLMNHYRHVRTSINVYLKALVIGLSDEKEERDVSKEDLISFETIKSRVSPFIIVDVEAKAKLGKNAYELLLRKLDSSNSIDHWLDAMSELVRQGLIEDRKSRPNRSIYEAKVERQSPNSGPMVSHTLTLYSGRFTHYVYKTAINTLGIKSSNRYRLLIERQNQDRIEQLEKLAIKTHKETFDSLVAMAAKRPNRTVNASSNFIKTTRKEFTQKFDLEGRALVIEIKGNGAREELIEKLMENLKIQFELKIYGQNLLSGGVEDSQGELLITLEKPKKADLVQIKRILNALS
jgi:hypothetical protein